MSSLIKLPIILAVSAALHVAHTTPNKASSSEEATVNTMLEWVLQSGMSSIKFFKGIFWAVAAAETAAIISTTLLSSFVDPRIASALVKSGNPNALRLTPLSTIGAALVVGGALVRLQCYRTLRSLFTFKISIRKDHRLVTTGPYAVVRHPSYAGSLAIHIGMYCWWGSRGSWLRESGFLDTIGGKIALWVFATYMMGGLGAFLMRAPVEDAALKKQFGTQWSAYARQVPYAIVPGIY